MVTPKALIKQIFKGKVVLLLGSGALYGANLPNKKVPLGNDLRDILCDEYLDDDYKQESLAHVADIAISQSGLSSVQDFIRDYFSDLEPAEFHYKIPLFKWRALFTTNYDRLLEITYETVKDKVQDYVLMLSNEDKIDETRVTSDKVPLIKLHGCITRTHDKNLPLILTTDQYNESFKNRKRLFDLLYELAYENTIVFVGHSLQDFNIRSVMLQLQKEAPQGQRHYLIKPKVKEAEKEYWAEKKITALDITFSDFLSDVENSISEGERTLSLILPNNVSPIQSFFTENSGPSDELLGFLTNSVEFIHDEIPIEKSSAKDFYKGVDLGWYSISESLGIKRNVEKQIFESVVEKPDGDRSQPTDFYIIKGEAGSGKTILLRQLAWSIKDSKLGIPLWVKPGCCVDIDIIEELILKTKERIFILWDDAAINAIELNRSLTKAIKKNLKVTFITAERYNEWNTRCDELDEILTDDFNLRYLSESEIDQLLEKLELYNSLGPNLIHKNIEQRRKELKEIHGRQLLVALHEATMGEPFEDIVFNEYKNITPESAKSIYLTVCTLNRMRVPVRAGLISRIHDINFDTFSQDFYKPLERIVIVKGQSEQDIHYTARHSEIAEIVFKRAFSNTEERYNEYISILSKLNISFSTDKSSFRTLIKAKALSDLFPSYEDVNSLYKHALNTVGEDPYLLQQMANYERIRPNGSLDRAIELLTKAKNDAPHDSSILHSLSTVWRDKAEGSKDIYQRTKCRAESRSYIEQALKRWGGNSYLSTSLIGLSIDNLKDLLNDEHSTQHIINEAIKKVQHELTENKQKYPSEGHVYELESKFSKLIKDNDGAIKAMEKAFEEKDRDPYIAIRLASSYMDLNFPEKAKKLLQDALERRRADHRLNFHYAEVLRVLGANSDELMYYYRRAFTPKDKNYQAQFWFARFAYSSDDERLSKLSRDTFDQIRKARLPHKDRVEIRDYDGGVKTPRVHHGSIIRIKDGFSFIKVDGSGEEVFCPSNGINDEFWEVLQAGDRIKFNLGYTFTGLVCCNVSI